MFMVGGDKEVYEEFKPCFVYCSRGGVLNM